MHSQRPHPGRTQVVRNVRYFANRQQKQKCGHLWNSQLPPAKWCISVSAGRRDSSQEGPSVPSIIQGQNSTHSSSLNNSLFADITQLVTSTPSATLRQSINNSTTSLGKRCPSTPAPGGTIQTASTHRVLSRPVSGIASTPTPHSGLENLATPIPNPEAHVIITNPLRMRAADKNQRHGQWQLQPQAVSTPRSMVSSSRSIHQFGYSEMTHSCIFNG